MSTRTLVHSLLLLVALTLTGAVYAGQEVNVNTATAEELSQALDGVGLKKAEAIVAYRTDHGAYTAAEDLLAVKGIGEKTIERNREFIKLN